MSRYRLRKKMGLDNTELLPEYQVIACYESLEKALEEAVESRKQIRVIRVFLFDDDQGRPSRTLRHSFFIIEYAKGSDKGFDGRGNYTMGITEQIIFPEIDIDKVSNINGMDITFVTSAKNDVECLALLKQLGIPFKNQNK